MTAYVNLPEAVRLVVRLMPGGETLASKLTDEWIVGNYRFWNSDNYPDDDPLMNGIYGPDWRDVRPRVVAAYGRALNLLDKVVSSGRVSGVGVSAAAREKTQRLIEAYEWASRSLNVSRGVLDTPAGKSSQTRPPILDVLVSVEDLKRECAAMIASEAETVEFARPDLVVEGAGDEQVEALNTGKLKAIGSDHKELPPGSWDDKSVDLSTSPEARFRREDMLREWPDIEATAKDGSEENAGPPEAKAPEVPAAAAELPLGVTPSGKHGSSEESPPPASAELPARKRTRARSLNERLAAELLRMCPDARPPKRVEELGRDLKKRPGVGTFGQRTLERAIKRAWPSD